MRLRATFAILATAVAALFVATAAQADITVGVTLSATGPAASLGIPEKNTIALLPKTIGGQKVNYAVLDDAADLLTYVRVPYDIDAAARKILAAGLPSGLAHRLYQGY